MSMTTETPLTAGRLSGKSAVITGAGHGIGRATAIHFADEGARLVLNDLDRPSLAAVAKSLRSAGAEIVEVAGNVADPADAESMITAAVSSYGTIDILVANAGVIPLGTIVETSPDDWDSVMDVDARGMFLTCKYAITEMARRGSGSIVCLSSISGMAGQRGQAAYGPAKFVATGLTRHLAVEWAEHGIRVNAVAPGTIETEAVRRLVETAEGRRYVDLIREQHPMKRLGQPAEVARAILFLASDDASFITGEVLAVDGGYLAQ
jgi:NAD(P)-dependent dehydrogenase (short-subunit alcohol dehydrogenase family)